jgi:TonB family protein
MVPDTGENPVQGRPAVAEPELRLLVELAPWRRAFLENVRDTLPRRKSAQYRLRYPNAEFWPDVFVSRGVAWPKMRLSGLGHVLLLLAIYGLSTVWMADQSRHPQVRIHPVIHYDLSEYLPPMDTGAPPALKPQEGKPLLAKQKIISLQPNADNREQTILSPVDVKLPANIALPNIVAWTATPGVPTATASRDASQIRLPQVAIEVIAPAPEAMERDISRMKIANATAKVVEPAPEVHDLQTRRLEMKASVVEPPAAADIDKLRRRNLNAPSPSVIEPPPDANVASKLGPLNVGHLTATVASPRIPVTEERAAITLAPSKRGGGPSAASEAGGGAPPISPVGGLRSGPSAGQLIALNLHPAIPNGPLNVPPGGRAGEFAAGPEGKKDAPGTPEIKAGGRGPGGGGENAGGAGKGGAQSLPAGITIGDAPGAPPAGSAVVAGEPHRTPELNHAAKQTLMANNHPPRIGELPRASASVPDTRLAEDRVFGDKKIYTLALNMPNLVSSGGSWIIRFAPLDEDDTSGQVSAPVAMTKVDPAYPAELMRDRVEGTVILYAIIHKDGSVGSVRVLHSVQGRLDESARLALARWKFRPGTKNGQAVDLEAVVQIPFKAVRTPF